MPHLLLDMIAHMRWADAAVADAIGATERRRDLSPSADPVALFAHIAAAEHLWYSRIMGEGPRYAVWPDLSVPAARAVAEQHAALFEKLIGGGGESELQRVVAYRNSAGQDFRNSVEEIVTHVTMHGSYHRGQIARLIRASGGAPPYTDYIQFMRRTQLA
jgi:uncharacterized damage-inducible protein DinB